MSSEDAVRPPGRSSGRVPEEEAAEQHAHDLSDRDRTTADADQAGSDLEQMLSDSDQASSDRDQRAADRDQRLADRDQEAGGDARHPDADGGTHERARRGRSQSAADRARSTDARLEATELRLANATRRDRAAQDRDAAADARDRLSASIDAEFELVERLHATDEAIDGRPPDDLVHRLAAHLKRAADARSCAAAHRDAAAIDRQEAARDREHAAHDRRQAARELARESVDHLTGVLGRRAGLAALQREMDRTARSEEPLVVAFVDVDGLKAINDTQGHPAGDRALRAVALRLRETLRSYDVVLRYGGDEFLCSLAGHDLAGARARFDQIAAGLDDHAISVGLALHRPPATLQQLIAQADEALLEVRGRRAGTGRDATDS